MFVWSQRNLMKHKNKTMELVGVLVSDFIVLRGAAVSSLQSLVVQLCFVNIGCIYERLLAAFCMCSE